MANLSITNVKLPSSGVKPIAARLGETAEAFDLVYLSGSKFYLADSSSTARSAVTHMVMQPGVVDDYLVFIPVAAVLEFVGPTLVIGDEYLVSSTPGKMCLKSDLVTGDYISEVGHASTESELQIRLNPTGIQIS